MGPAPERTYEIEKMADLKAAQGMDNLGFDNSGNIVNINRKYRRNLKRLWRAVNEGRKTIHWYTRKHNKTTKATKKRERQNRHNGRLGIYA